VSTNEFTFDTFEETFLDSPGVKVIEARITTTTADSFRTTRSPQATTILSARQD